MQSSSANKPMTLTACLKQLKEDLKAIIPRDQKVSVDKITVQQLNTLDDSTEAEVVLRHYKESNDPTQTYSDIINDRRLGETIKNYSSNALQAAFNVANILEKVIGDNTTTLTSITWNLGTHGQINNLVSSLTYLDSLEHGHGVPYIIDDTTYKINQAIVTFINSVDRVSSKNAPEQGKKLIKATKYLGDLSFDSMRQAAQARIGVYEDYQKLPINRKPRDDSKLEAVNLNRQRSISFENSVTRSSSFL